MRNLRLKMAATEMECCTDLLVVRLPNSRVGVDNIFDFTNLKLSIFYSKLAFVYKIERTAAAMRAGCSVSDVTCTKDWLDTRKPMNHNAYQRKTGALDRKEACRTLKKLFELYKKVFKCNFLQF